MSTEGKFSPDHISDHLQEIQSLIGHEQGRLIKEGWGRGPAYYQACENVGQEHFWPSIGGPKLASKVGVLTAQNARDAKMQIEPSPESLVTPSSHNGSINIIMGEIEDIPIGKSRGTFSGDPNIEHLKEVILAMPVGKALPAMFDDQVTARKTANRLYAWANQIHAKDNGWTLRAPSTDRDGSVKFLKVPYHKR